MVRLGLLFVFCWCLLSVNAQETSRSINAAIGIQNAVHSSTAAGNIAARVDFRNKLFGKFNLCIGLNYDVIDKPPQIIILTYDQKYYGGYVGVNYQISLNKSLRVCPEFDLGYSIIEYTMNEFNVGKQKTSGFLLQYGCDFVYDLNNHYTINFGCFKTTLKKDLDTKVDFLMPASYIIQHKKFRSNLLVKLGIGVKF